MTALGLGCAAFGNLYAEVSATTATATLRSAWELGVRHFDTAPHYGLGLSERRVGDALRAVGAATGPLASAGDVPAGPALVSTKAGRLLEPNPDHVAVDRDPEGFVVPAALRRRWDFTPDGLRRSLEESLERLGIDRVDTLYLHDPDVYDLETGIRTSLPALARLRDEGVVRRIGVGSNDETALARCVREADLDVVMCAGRYTLLEQPASRELLPLCLERGVAVVAAGVYNSGALATDDFPDVVLYNYEPAPPEVVGRLRRLHELCAAHGVTVPQAAVRFVARHPAVEVVMLGARSPEEVRQAHERFTAEVPDALWDDLPAALGVETPDAR